MNTNATTAVQASVSVPNHRPGSFLARVLGQAGVLRASCTMDELEELEAQKEPKMRLTPDCEERSVTTERYLVVGGLCQDEDAVNPLEDYDGEGTIFHHGRRARRDEAQSYNAALGLDEDGNKDLAHEAVSEAIGNRACASIRPYRGLMTTLSNLIRGRKVAGKVRSGKWDEVLELLASAVHQEGYEFALDYIADWFLDVSYWAHVSDEWCQKLDLLEEQFSEAAAEAAWEGAMAAGKLGEPLAQMLDIYEHGGIAYSLSGQGMQCRWDTSSGGAVWVPCALAKENIRAAVDEDLRASGRVVSEDEMAQLLREKAASYCKGVLEDYNAYCNGDAYGVVAYVIDRETGERVTDYDHEVWGYLGRSYAEQELDEVILRLVGELVASRH